MMKALIKERPENPVEFLIDKLTQPERKRIVLILPPGLKQQSEDSMNVALMLHNHLKEDLGVSDIDYISVSDLLNKETQKKTEYGKLIKEIYWKNYSFVKDEIVIDLVQKEIKESERKKHGWILEGFPRTRMQALALQNMKIIPDKIFLLNMNDTILYEKVNRKLVNNADVVASSHQELQEFASNAITEFRVNL